MIGFMESIVVEQDWAARMLLRNMANEDPMMAVDMIGFMESIV